MKAEEEEEEKRRRRKKERKKKERKTLPLISYSRPVHILITCFLNNNYYSYLRGVLNDHVPLCFLAKIL
jgi:hypothetical protein